MSLNNEQETEMRRNARWLLRLTVLLGALTKQSNKPILTCGIGV